MKRRFSLRLITVALAILMAISLFACAEHNPSDNKPTAEPTGNVTGQPTGVVSPTEPEEQRVDHEISKKDYDYDIRTLHWSTDETNSWIVWEEIDVEERNTGDLLVADIYDRNAWMEEDYNIRITNEYGITGSNLQSVISTSVLSGDDDYQLFVCYGYGICHYGTSLFGNNMFLNMSEIQNINFEHPWWVDDSVETLKIGEYVEFVASDMLLLDKGATNCIYFNKQKTEDLGITDLYDVVRNMDWTYEKLAEYAELGNLDNGDDQWDNNDDYGMVGGDDPVLAFYLSSGFNFIKKNDEGYYFYEYGTEDSLNVMISILDTVMYGDFFYNTWINRNLDTLPSFKDSDSVFDCGMVKNCVSLRQVEFDYGILPIPLYDYVQEDYYSWVHSYHDSLMAIPLNTGNPEAVGAAMELLGWYSYYNIYSDLYETVICDRGTRDDDSVEMLKIIFKNRRYDLGVIKDVNNFTDNVLRYTATKNTNVKSFLEKYENILDSNIEDLNAIVDTYQ